MASREQVLILFGLWGESGCLSGFLEGGRGYKPAGCRTDWTGRISDPAKRVWRGCLQFSHSSSVPGGAVILRNSASSDEEFVATDEARVAREFKHSERQVPLCW
jgi:hypothetical protein